MNADSLAKYQSSVIAAQAAGALTSYLLESIIPFIAIQAVVAFSLMRLSAGASGGHQKFIFYYYLSLAVSVPFVGSMIFIRTLTPLSKDKKRQGGGQKLKKDIEEHIRAGWEPYQDLKFLQSGPPSLQKSAIPIIDVLSGPDLEVKRKAIVILQKLRSVRAIGLLKHALNDNSVEIKFMAASALLSIENEFKAEVKNITSEIERALSQGRRSVCLLRKDLAGAIHRYIASGLLDEVSRKNLQEQMISELNMALREDQDFLEVRFMLAREYSKKGMFRESLAELTKILDNPKTSALAGEELKISAIVLYCEIYYCLEDYDKLGEVCRHIGDHIDISSVKKHPGLEEYYRSILYFSGKAAK